ncbi:MAG: hypothetical protein A2138_05015 [Deltaproteobacteria bacterium RBG_16_71_12]|nr:MAG: hypothetical protein A2138_05015 [Deltaproteobacteria bacterium RBG_16_71_12]
MRAHPILLGMLLVIPSVALAAPAHAGERCFDLSTPLVAPPRASLPLPTAGGDASAAGARGDVVWAQRRGVVRRPIEKLRAYLEDPRHFKDQQVDEMTVAPMPTGPLLKHHQVHSLVRPFPLVTVEWTDEWSTSLLAGSRDRPDAVLIAYQKVAGTSYIARFCGTLVLTRIDEQTTDVAQFEEATITGRSHDDMKQGLADMLATLRALP